MCGALPAPKPRHASCAPPNDRELPGHRRRLHQPWHCTVSTTTGQLTTTAAAATFHPLDARRLATYLIKNNPQGSSAAAN